jgi:hypothetical protein
MMSSAAWGTPSLVVYHAVHDPQYGTALSGRVDTVAVPLQVANRACIAL